jgi:alkanesulfonate monooxygenase SsuD/methylene tetrahydromethanopterin reductase-like flavin-dependent oxidoreductase (luciferase family)
VGGAGRVSAGDGGVGVGWAQAEFAALGVPFAQRRRLSDDYLTVLQTCWSQEVASAATRTVQFAEVHTARLEPGYVVIDTYSGRPEDLSNTEAVQRTLDVLVEGVLDLSRGAFR